MENPCLTFVTPTLLAGDRSLTSVVAHEIAHRFLPPTLFLSLLLFLLHFVIIIIIIIITTILLLLL